ncbi:ABC transporter ATP-binding protein [Patescibacteria group bacterium]|nr:ABC transporter ATP-binding protein [Patescibacteria group bacterium]
MSILIAENLTKVYGRKGARLVALDQVSFEAKSGETTLIMGPSGSGKTTLLLLLGTLLCPTAGRVLLDGRSLSDLKVGDLSSARLQTIGFVFQHFNLLASLTAIQNVMVPRLAAGLGKKEAERQAAVMLDRFGLAKRQHALPADLSGGEQQRVAIARALMNSPTLLLADEPTANLDSRTGHEIVQTLSRTAKEEGKIVIIVSHDPRIQDIADRVISLEDGKIKERDGRKL